MALIKLTAFIDQISGKLNGTVFSKNKGGAYVRSKSKPTNPRSAAQMAVRSAFGAIAAAWRDLTESQRKAWMEATKDFPYQNRLGDRKTLTGFSLHQKINRNLQLVSQPAVQIPPTPDSPAGITVLEMAGFNATGSLEGETEATVIVVFATAPISPGVSNFSNRLRLIGTITPAELEAGTDLGTMHRDVFGTAPADAKIGFKFTPIHTVSGIDGAPFEISTVNN